MIRDYTASLVSELLLEHYGLKGSIKELAGYTDKNFMLKVENEGVERYTIKISSVRENRNLIEMQNFVFKQMEEQGFQGQGCKFPRLIPTLERKDMVIISESNESNYLRILTYVEGHEIWELEDAPLHLFDEAGQLAAHLSIFLEKISYDPLVISLNSNGSSDNHYDNISTVNIYF
jgi:Ser/Thr protein kinase RdoA (MazF antagonist)